MVTDTKDIITIPEVSEIEIVYRSTVKPSQRPQVFQSKDSYQILYGHWDKNRIDFIEQFKVIFLNTANRILAMIDLTSGGLTGTIADPRLIFATALKINATAIILAHNHPSGNLKPSNADQFLTQKIKNAGSFLDIKVIDHIILTTEGYYSFADEGLL